MIANVEHELVSRFVRFAKQQRYTLVDITESVLPGCSQIRMEHDPTQKFKATKGQGPTFLVLLEAGRRARSQAWAEGYSDFVHTLYYPPQMKGEEWKDLFDARWTRAETRVTPIGARR